MYPKEAQNLFCPPSKKGEYVIPIGYGISHITQNKLKQKIIHYQLEHISIRIQGLYFQVLKEHYYLIQKKMEFAKQSLRQIVIFLQPQMT